MELDAAQHPARPLLDENGYVRLPASEGSNAQQDPQVGQKWSAILEMAPGYFSNLFLQIRGKDYGKAVYKVFSRIQRQMSTPPHSRKEAPLLLEFGFSPDSWKL